MPFEIDPSYKEVSERIADLFAKHPEASLRGTYEVLALGDRTFIAYRAECYRTADDAAPGVGTAWEEYPGRTPYTKGSELQNAETSAWGRAIVAVGASESKRIASANDVRGARARQNAEAGSSRAAHSDTGASVGPSPTGASTSNPGNAASATSPARRQNLKSRCSALLADKVSVADERIARGLPKVDDCDDIQLQAFEAMVSELEAELSKPFETAVG